MGEKEQRKSMILNCNGLSCNLNFGTEINEEVEVTEKEFDCFDGFIFDSGNEKYIVDVNKLRYETFEDYIYFNEIIQSMMHNPGTVTIIEILKNNGVKYEIHVTYYDCYVRNYKNEIKATETTVETFKFKSGQKDRKFIKDNVIVNGVDDLEILNKINV